MKPIFLACFVLLGLISSFQAANPNRPSYIECQSDAECAPDHCCTIGPLRYSVPQCQRIHEKGDVCRPSHVPINTTLNYPDGNQVQLTNVHYLFCPCAYGLGCEKETGTCKDQKHESNELQGDKTEKD